MYRYAPNLYVAPQLGMGSACCSSCAHGGSCDSKSGMGLFESGIDFTQWGWPEWSIAILGSYMIMSSVFTTSRAVKKVRAIPGERRKKKAAYYRAKAKELGKIK